MHAIEVSIRKRGAHAASLIGAFLRRLKEREELGGSATWCQLKITCVRKVTHYGHVALSLLQIHDDLARLWLLAGGLWRKTLAAAALLGLLF